MQLTENEIFLMHCISQLKGTNDFQKIANDMNIVSLVAARQKMVRFRKAFKEHLEGSGIQHSNSEENEEDVPATPKKQKKRQEKDVLSARARSSRVDKKEKLGRGRTGKTAKENVNGESGDEGKEGEDVNVNGKDERSDGEK